MQWQGVSACRQHRRAALSPMFSSVDLALRWVWSRALQLSHIRHRCSEPTALGCHAVLTGMTQVLKEVPRYGWLIKHVWDRALKLTSESQVYDELL